MNILGLELSWSPSWSPSWRPAASRKSTLSLDDFIRRMEAAYQTGSGVAVTPETAMQSPTVAALVTAISRRIATLPIRVQRKSVVNGRETRKTLPDHDIARLLARPNDWHNRVTFWLDATSALVRHGNFYAVLNRGRTGPVRRMFPVPAGAVKVKQADDWSVSYETTLAGGATQTYAAGDVLHARAGARDGLVGDSPITDLRESIALEIAAERMGAKVFANSAVAGMVFEYQDGFQGHKSEEDRKKFVDQIQDIYAAAGRFRSILLPKGVTQGDPIRIDNEKAQFLETRQFQRTVIAGAFGVPPHMVGDLTNGTFQNVEQQSLDFVTNVVLPYVRMFEAALEQALLTDEDRADGLVIRFNIDAALRADFKTRQEGLQIQRQAGVISANDWREAEGLNPLPAEDGGDEYWRQGPSGQSADIGADAGDAADPQSAADPAAAPPKKGALYVAA